MDINTFINRIVGEAYNVSYAFRQIAVVLRQLIQDSNAKHILYPKGLFIKDSNEEVYIFESNGVMRFSVKDHSVSVETWKYLDIQKLELSLSPRNNQHNKTLSICFSNGDVIKLDSCNDTNDHWSHNYAEKLLELFQWLRSYAK
ncbi:DUF3908 family protein [Paenibacillus abyssi]|uniref:Uncharacterized protein n=1 Tax=Paenibacillus abyssi TaxID=1340531 RepID=A0A917D1I3_9BACL|nr:DUF3908 family protein [Paenibacillus abyssi]GGG07553.1 hypothetical protein GCM10010916_25550 [Paenibacillus abyssi]